jgi:hypothetical protein
MDGRRVVQSNGILACILKEATLVHRLALAALPYFGSPSPRSDNFSGEAGYLRDTFGGLHNRFRFALLFSRAFFVGLCIDRFRKFGQLFVSFCFFFDGLLQ